MRKRITLMALMSLMAVTLPAASAGGAAYNSLGGKKAIAAAVDAFVARVAADDRINAYVMDTASDAARRRSLRRTGLTRSVERQAVLASTLART